MSDMSRLLEQLSAVAEQRSNLLAAEAKLWADTSRALNKASLIEFARLRKAESPPDKGRARFLSTKEAAEFLSLAPTTLNKWRVHGGGPKFTKLGRRIFYPQSALESFVAAKTYPHTAAYK